ncbi:hypothetical protein K501DRAFT_94885 [Backusella circina FSU 941]|nr:hypothetical protein K501DRAFT_94885 [Backusella circina FSU 941]
MVIRPETVPSLNPSAITAKVLVTCPRTVLNLVLRRPVISATKLVISLAIVLMLPPTMVLLVTPVVSLDTCLATVLKAAMVVVVAIAVEAMVVAMVVEVVTEAVTTVVNPAT